jgi:hypothetical protein
MAGIKAADHQTITPNAPCYLTLRVVMILGGQNELSIVHQNIYA